MLVAPLAGNDRGHFYRAVDLVVICRVRMGFVGRQMRIVAVAAAVLVVLCGCARTVDDANPVKEPQKVDCDLIFPGPSNA